ncbi:MAG: GNAT family N-acetyltransferase [Betaproteobacteria bacterium]|jgi:acetyltransferase|nr:GNAT family N-acetyltransferase [Betaproteobacteria bacterium]
MTVRAIRALFEPERIAFAPGAHGDAAAERTLRANLAKPGLAVPVQEITHRLPRDVRFDLGVIALPNRHAESALERLARHGCQAAVLVDTHMRRTPETVRELQALRALARELGLRTLGPSRGGVIVPALGMSAGTVGDIPVAGSFAFVTQSDSVLVAMLDRAAARGIGFSKVASVGKPSDVVLGDLLDYLAADEETRAVLVHLENVADPRRFVSAARAVAWGKPVLVLRGGRSCEPADIGEGLLDALVRRDDVYDAVFHRTGLVRVPSIDAMFDAALALSRFGPRHVQALRRGRLAILANGTGAALLAADALAAGGGTLAPLGAATRRTLARSGALTERECCVDLGVEATPARFADALKVVLAGGETDCVLAIFAPAAGANSVAVATAVADATTRSNGGIVIAAWLGAEGFREAQAVLERAGVPLYRDTVEAVDAFLAGVRAGRAREQLAEIPSLVVGAEAPRTAEATAMIDAALARGRQFIQGDDALELLEAYGIHTAGSRRVRTIAEAHAAARAVGFPVSVAGLVRGGGRRPARLAALEAGDAGALAKRCRTLRERARRMHPGARLASFLVSAARRPDDSLSLMLGVTTDPLFGPVIVVGQGGPHFAAMDDLVCALPPLNAALARSALGDTRIGRLLLGETGRSTANAESVITALVQLSQLAADQPALVELIVNPLLAAPHGALALAAEARLAKTRRGARGADRLAIRPYPRSLECTVRLRDGTETRMRPIRPEDARAMQSAFLKMTPEDRRMRLFTPMNVLRDDLAARYTAIDYDREMALVIEDVEHPGELWGGARIVADPDGVTADYAVSTRSDAQHRGIGETALRAILAYAAERGIRSVRGSVLRENAAMRALAKRVGFRETHDPDDPACVLTVIDPARVRRP